jgi:hypothetical protein
MKLNNLKIGFAISSIALMMFSCKKDNSVAAPTVTKQWSIALSSKNEVPAPVNRAETGTATLELRSDNSLKYTISINNLASGDALMAAHLHIGNVVTSGGVVLSLNPMFTGGNATGTILNVRQTLVDSLKSDMNELYFNVHSSQVGSGLVRGQLNVGIDMAVDVPLSGANEVPAVTTATTGLAILRLTSDKKLYSKVMILNVAQGDAMAAAHIHKGATGANGTVILALCSSAADFGTAKMFPVDDVFIASLKTDAIYVNAHSTYNPSGIVRGQIR